MPASTYLGRVPSSKNRVHFFSPTGSFVGPTSMWPFEMGDRQLTFREMRSHNIDGIFIRLEQREKPLKMLDIVHMIFHQSIS
jgi:hypothetical protein